MSKLRQYIPKYISNTHNGKLLNILAGKKAKMQWCNRNLEMYFKHVYKIFYHL